MAKIKFGMMMTDARGKLGGQVFSKNRSGAYVRTKVTPVNPRTSAQQTNRSLLGQLSSAWSGLTEEQIRAWNKQVNEWQKTNVFGDLQKPTGKNLFTSLNKNRLNYFPSLDLQFVPPAKAEFSSFSLSSVTATASTKVLDIFFSLPISADRDFRVRCTPLLGNGISYFNNLFRNINVTRSPNVDGQISIGTLWVARFGAMQAGMRIAIEVSEVAENGQIGTPAVIVAVVG